MKVKLDEKFFVEIDANDNYILREDKGTREVKGKEIPNYKDYGYFSNMAQAIKKYVRVSMLSDFDELDLKEYIDIYLKRQDDILERVKL